jgi:hypothetical protein
MIGFERALKKLGRARVKFVVIGGLAAALRGSASMTDDVDICYERSPANLQRFSKALESFHPRRRDAPRGLPFRLDAKTLALGMNLRLTTDVGDLDLCGEVPGIGNYKQGMNLSETVQTSGQRLSVLSLEGLIRSRRAVGRTKALLILPELEALKELLSSSRTKPIQASEKNRTSPSAKKSSLPSQGH